jgi:DNA polymerase I
MFVEKTKKKMLIVAASYDPFTVDVELFGRLEDGNSATVLIKNFKPYFHCLGVSQGLYVELANHPDVADLEWCNLTWEGLTQRFLKVVLWKPYKTRVVRELCEQLGGQPFAGDIVFTNRVFYDLDLSIFVEFEGAEAQSLVGKYSTNKVYIAESIKACEPCDISPLVLSFDMEVSRTQGPFLICIVCGTQKVTLLGTGKDLIKQFEETVRRLDPDVISGFNINGYDLMELGLLAQRLGLPGLFIGRKAMAAQQRQASSKSYDRQWWVVPGRAVIDTMREAIKRLQPQRHSLDFIGRTYLGAGKVVPMNRNDMDGEFVKDPERVERACMEDTELTHRLYLHMNLNNIYKAVGVVGKLPFAAVSTGTTNPPLESLLIREFDRRGHAVPMNKGAVAVEVPKEEGEDDGSEVGGTFVYKTKAGLHEWVAGLDTRSLYPHVIIKNNICLSTYAGRQKGEAFHSVEIWDITKENHLFDVAFHKERKGIVPAVVERLFKRRMELLAQRDEAAGTKDYDFYDTLQNALKINLLNSIYGLMASNFSRFSNSDMGNAVIWGGRAFTENTIARVQEAGYGIIIADTDSLYVKLMTSGLDAAVAEAKSLGMAFSTEDFKLEVEKVYSILFTHGAKKRYIGTIVWPKEKRDVKGYETRRTDSFPLVTKGMEKAFDYILARDVESLTLHSRNVVRCCLAGDVPIEELVISRGVKKEEDYANANSMANVQAARKLRDAGEVVTWNMKVSYIVTNSDKTPMEVEPYIDGQAFKAKPDFGYYGARLARSLSRLTDYFGLGEDELITGQRQMKLGDFK